MPKPSKSNRAFRIGFLLLLAAALATALWELAHRPPEPSRVDWPAPTHR